MIYRPYRWVVLKIENYYKVFGAFYGDAWKINSGISSVEEDEYHYYFHSLSGSTYKCNKNTYGITNPYCNGVLNKILTQKKVSLMDKDTNWFKLIYLPK